MSGARYWAVRGLAAAAGALLALAGPIIGVTGAGLPPPENALLLVLAASSTVSGVLLCVVALAPAAPPLVPPAASAAGIADPNSPACPRCHGRTVFLPERGRWYCQKDSTVL